MNVSLVFVTFMWELQQEIGSYLRHKKEEGNVKYGKHILKNIVKNKSSINSSGQTKEPISIS